ncbi:SURF1 family protein [Rhizobium sp. RCAM05350]|nr:SURF1 family protein [Rhizobium sp. RCAM05350]
MIFVCVMVILAAMFMALGTWQVQRLFWKNALIERVDARVHAVATPAPPEQGWTALKAENDEYRRVVIEGRFRHDAETLVQAVTDLGAGFWVVTPLETADGTTVLINRGFVATDQRDPGTRAAGEIQGNAKVTGLLRMTEPGGAFLRSNDPQQERWYSRDVAAIAAAKGLGTTAPYFIDADATANPGGFPVGGLTVIRFRNSHLVYALTWYGLALMTSAATIALRRRRLI